MLQNSRYADRVLLHNKAYRSNSRSISVLPIACYLKFLCCLCDNIIAQAGMSNYRLRRTIQGMVKCFLLSFLHEHLYPKGEKR